jgi:hypothetical protein
VNNLKNGIREVEAYTAEHQSCEKDKNEESYEHSLDEATPGVLLDRLGSS